MQIFMKKLSCSRLYKLSITLIMKEGESMYLAKVIKTGNRLYVYDAFNNKLATINSEKELF